LQILKDMLDKKTKGSLKVESWKCNLMRSYMWS